MEKRKKLIKLFSDIADFIQDNNYLCSPWSFLLNKRYLVTNRRRVTTNLLSGITKEEFTSISNRFDNRITGSFMHTLSLTDILTLPKYEVRKASIKHSADTGSLLLLSDSVILDDDIEQSCRIHITYRTEASIRSPFSNVFASPLSKEKPLSITLQATLFDVIENETSPHLKPHSFDVIIDSAIDDDEIPKSLIETASTLLARTGRFILLHKKNFLISSSKKREKMSLYVNFDISEIYKEDKYLAIHLVRKNPMQPHHSINIADNVSHSILSVNNNHLTGNNLLTFNDSLSHEEIALLEKIETRADGKKAIDYFKFFIGMFPKTGYSPVIDPLRRNNHFKPFLRAREINAFEAPSASAWILPEEEKFHQIPPQRLFESPKLIARYLSVRPIFSIDNSGLYFLYDVAGIIPKTEDIVFEYAEGFFNSNVILFYYTLKFPHHAKFIKRNFNTIPFVKPQKSMQKIFEEKVKELRALLSAAIQDDAAAKKAEELKRLIQNYFYQLFKLSPDEVRIIEKNISKYLK